MASTTSQSKLVRKVIFAVIWLVIWQVLALCINNKILIAGPIQTIKALFVLASDSTFRFSVLSSLCRISAGFMIGSLSAFLLAVIAYKLPIFEEFLSPLVSVIKAVPVVSFIIIVLIWAGPSVSLVISSLVVFPIVYINALNGLKSTDIKLLQMADVFGLRFFQKLKFIYLPSIKSHLLSAVSLASGMAWKSGIAAELIDQTQNSLGNGIYRAKINLLTADLLAWTVATVLLSFVFEIILKLLLGLILGSKRRTK